VESWFLRANHPTAARALWLKATLLSGRRPPAGDSAPFGRAQAHVWGTLFDATGPQPRVLVWRGAMPLAQAGLSQRPPWRLQLGACRFEFSSVAGASQGSLPPASPGTVDALRWDLSWAPHPAAAPDLTTPFQLFPSRAWIDRAWPRNKLVTPAPLLRFQGTIEFAGESWAIDDWIGMQGHNWGPAHAPEYVWTQAVFWDGEQRPFALLEAAIGRIRLPLRRRSPLFTLLTLRLPEREFRFDRLEAFYRHHIEKRFPALGMQLRGAAGKLSLQAHAAPPLMVDLPYRNPDGGVSHCLNSKLAALHLHLEPENDDSIHLSSAHGAALEFLYEPADLPPAARSAAISSVATEPAALPPRSRPASSSDCAACSDTTSAQPHTPPRSL
jgi:hypothetical protein